MSIRERPTKADLGYVPVGSAIWFLSADASRHGTRHKRTEEAVTLVRWRVAPWYAPVTSALKMLCLRRFWRQSGQVREPWRRGAAHYLPIRMGRLCFLTCGNCEMKGGSAAGAVFSPDLPAISLYDSSRD